MTRSPLFYPMRRGDSDAGGDADLQTDIMRFMAILALCLVAIFALVQSIPLSPVPATQSQAAVLPLPVPVETQEATSPRPPPVTAETTVTPVQEKHPEAVVTTTPKPKDDAKPQSPVAATPTEQGFSLRFESDLALTRLVAAGQVGFYAIGDGRAQRMTVSESRISFWDASAPQAFHAMESLTVPRPVIDALARTGVDTDAVDWGVTLPGKLRGQLDSLLQSNSGGALIIGADGSLRLESS